MRSVLSTGARRWAAMRSWPANRLRARFFVALALAALAPISFVLTASTEGADSGTGAATAASARRTPTQPARTHPARYRIVGCASHGSDAYRHGPSRRVVALGFDDGPAPDTGAFVAMLARSHARATFFLVGRQVSGAYRPTLLRALREGDVLGDHTFNHPYLTRTRQVTGELQRTITAIRSLSGYTPCVFRPPYGAYDAAVVAAARSLGLATVLWNVDPRDWALPGRRAIEGGVLSQVRPGSIIISHDGGGPRGETLAAYPPIIATLRARGYGFVTIPELLGFRPVYAPCGRVCDGLGLARRDLPRGAIIKAAH
ncbi:MAG: polysaccharide deacetylase family protein [Actinomycetota bacterium]|nr:polysaccharide deacetylase family protein [Actinomycetota bacterium]